MILPDNFLFSVVPDFTVFPQREYQFRFASATNRYADATSWYKGIVPSRGDQKVYYRVSINSSPTITGLLKNEQRILSLLRGDTSEFKFDKLFLPRLTDAFDLPRQDGIYRVNVYGERDGEWYSLEEIKRYFPNGFPPKHMAWILRRITSILGYLYGRKIMHGAVLPHHVLIYGNHHLLNLTGNEYAVYNPARTGERINHIPFDEYFDWYPQWIFDQEGPKPYMDAVMALRCMVYLLDGNPMTGVIPFHPEIEPNSVYERIQEFYMEVIGSVDHELTAVDVFDMFTDQVLSYFWSTGVWEKKFYDFPTLS